MKANSIRIGRSILCFYPTLYIINWTFLRVLPFRYEVYAKGVRSLELLKRPTSAVSLTYRPPSATTACAPRTSSKPWTGRRRSKAVSETLQEFKDLFRWISWITVTNKNYVSPINRCSTEIFNMSKSCSFVANRKIQKEYPGGNIKGHRRNGTVLLMENL